MDRKKDRTMDLSKLPLKSGMNYQDVNQFCRLLKTNLDAGQSPEEAWANTRRAYEMQFKGSVLDGHKKAAFERCKVAIPELPRNAVLDGEPPPPPGPVIADTGAERKPRVHRR
jgi:hypothetical protein